MSPKSLLISGAENGPSAHGEVLLLKGDRKISKCGNTFPVHCQILNCAKVQLFQGGNRTCIVSYSHFRKLHLCSPVFLYLFLDAKQQKLNRAVIPSKWLDLEPYPPQFIKFGHVPAPLSW